jgi:GT2 family glycosyltransferase
MIGFGCAIGSEEKYRRFALPGIERVRQPEAPLIEVRGRDCLFRAYNEILDRVEADRRVEAIALIHEDTEIRDDYFEERVRWALRDPAVAIVGTIGGVGVRGIDWWIHDYGVGYSILEPIEPGVLYETPLLEGSEASGAGGFGTVDSVDGYLMVLSRWAIHELRFDEREVGPGFHGYDADICFQARERGRKVFAVGMDVAHHRNSVSPTPYREDWLRAQIAFRRKWERRRMLPVASLPFPPYQKTKQELEEERALSRT